MPEIRTLRILATWAKPEIMLMSVLDRSISDLIIREMSETNCSKPQSRADKKIAENVCRFICYSLLMLEKKKTICDSHSFHDINKPNINH